MKTRKINTLLKIFGFLTLIMMHSQKVFPQGAAINTTSTAADASAMLDVSSTTQGLLVPRMTEAQKNAIAAPATGLLIYQTDNTTGFWQYNGTSWVQSIGPTGPAGPIGVTGATGLLSNGSTAGNTPYWNGSAWVVNSSNIYNNGASIGFGTTSPNSSAKLDITSTTQGFLTPRMTESEKNLISSPANGLLIYQTDGVPGFYYYNGSTWAQNGATSHYVGERYGGGLVIAVWNDFAGGPQHGLIISLADLSSGLQWTTSSYQSTSVPGGTSSTTDGMANSNAIVAQAGAGTSYAAGLCRSYSAAGDGGLYDWYLPAREELYLCYLSKDLVNFLLGSTNGLKSTLYWTSNESSSSAAYFVNISNGIISGNGKDQTSCKVRAFRRF